MNPLLRQRIAQGLDHMLLAHHLLERTGAPLARQCLIGHSDVLGSASRGLSQISPASGDRARQAARTESRVRRRRDEIRWRTAPATPRRPNRSLPLLPSGPGGVYEDSSRGNRCGPPSSPALEAGALSRQRRAGAKPTRFAAGFGTPITTHGDQNGISKPRLTAALRGWSLPST